MQKIYIFLRIVGLLSFREIASIESGMGFLILKMRDVDSDVLNSGLNKQWICLEFQAPWIFCKGLLVPVPVLCHSSLCDLETFQLCALGNKKRKSFVETLIRTLCYSIPSGADFHVFFEFLSFDLKTVFIFDKPELFCRKQTLSRSCA